MKGRGVQLLFGVGLPTASFGPPRSPDRRPARPTPETSLRGQSECAVWRPTHNGEGFRSY